MSRDRDELTAQVAQRRAEIAQRLEQLAALQREIAERSTGAVTAARASSAREPALQAHAHAERAWQRAVARRRRSALAPERAADVLARHGNLERADWHRRAAAVHHGAAIDDATGNAISDSGD